MALWAATAAAQPQAPVVVPPKLNQFVQAEYPKSVIDQGNPQQVEVLLQIDIDATGGVSKVVVLQSGGDLFDAAATGAAQQFKFSPATVNGVATPVRIQYKYVFTPPVPAA
jgi:vitamin B12 transporter